MGPTHPTNTWTFPKVDTKNNRALKPITSQLKHAFSHQEGIGCNKLLIGIFAMGWKQAQTAYEWKTTTPIVGGMMPMSGWLRLYPSSWTSASNAGGGLKQFYTCEIENGT